MTNTQIYLALIAGAVGILLLSARYWFESNTSDMGTMSRQWLVENDQSRP